MLYRVVPAGFQDVVEAYHVALDVGVRVLNGIAHTCLGGKVYHNVEMLFGKEFFYEGFVGNVAFDETVLRFLDSGFAFARNDIHLFLDAAKPVLLEGRVVVIVQVVKAHNPHGFLAVKKPQNQI